MKNIKVQLVVFYKSKNSIHKTVERQMPEIFLDTDIYYIVK